MKPIEPGCWCLVKGGLNAGRSVIADMLVIGGEGVHVVIDGVRWIAPRAGVRYWACSGDVINATSRNPTLRKFNGGITLESNLLRIDGREPEKATKQKKEVSTC